MIGKLHGDEKNKNGSDTTSVLEDNQRSVVWFLMLENVLGHEIHAKMYVVYGVQNVIIKSIVNRRVQRFNVGQTSIFIITV